MSPRSIGTAMSRARCVSGNVASARTPVSSFAQFERVTLRPAPARQNVVCVVVEEEPDVVFFDRGGGRTPGDLFWSFDVMGIDHTEEDPPDEWPGEVVVDDLPFE